MINNQSVVDTLLRAAGLTPTEATNHGLRVRILRIGTNEARALLVANKDNRPIRRGRVLFYIRVMKQGGWMLTHQGIAFCVDGRGLDLQHRLTAIAESGVTVDMMVTEGLPAEAFEAIDQHERRSIADALRMDRRLTEVAKFLLQCRGGAGSSNPTTLEVGEACGAIDGPYQVLLAACSSARAVASAAPVRAAAVVLMMENPKNSLEVRKNYRAIVLDQLEVFTPAMVSFSKQIRSGAAKSGTGADRLDLYTRALIALDPARSDVSKVVVKDKTSISDAMSRAAKFLPE